MDDGVACPFASRLRDGVVVPDCSPHINEQDDSDDEKEPDHGDFDRRLAAS
jgi:hypothetical protein